jgi:hypothetical protein
VAKKLDPFIDNNDLGQVHYFCVSVWLSCFESTPLGFSKLMSVKKDEVSICYLLNMSIKNPSVYTSVSQADVILMSKRHQEKLVELEPLVKQVKMWRDRAIAHFDRKYINDPALITKMQPVKMGEVGKGLIMLQEIINVYRGWLAMGLLKLRDYELEMNSEWEYLVGLLQRNSLNKG